MEIELIRTNHGLSPVTDDGVEAVKKIKLGYSVIMTYKPRRNVKFHKKYFALLNAVIINQEHYKTVDNLHEAIKFKGGYYETVIPLDASPFLVTKSIAFHSMDAQEFEDFYSVALDECLKLVGEDAINDIIKFI